MRPNLIFSALDRSNGSYLEVSRRRGRPKAKVAAARKLLINCYIMLRDEISYEEFSRRGEVGLCVGSGEVKSKNLQSLKV